MRFLRLTVDGFGTLRGEHHFDPDRLTLVVDDNERGKSTLLAAIGAALYGLSDDKRTHRPITPLERWQPWEGGAFAVELELECGGERYTIRRDFQHGTVAVWNDRGQELTARFLEGKDEYPVGKHLLGLDVEEFEKCAFVRQEDLDQVVPADEKDRRSNSLQARLERAADTRAGNSSANEALRVLDEAAARYTEPLLDTTIKVENAIARLESQAGLLDIEIRALEADDASIRPQVERLSLIEDEARAEQERDRRLNAERRAALGAEARAKLERHHAQSAEIARFEQEALELTPYAGVPGDAGAQFGQIVARIEEYDRQREQLEANRDVFGAGIQHLDTELEMLGSFAALGDDDANRFIAQAAELRRLDGERDRVRAALERARAELAAKGFDAQIIERLDVRFRTIDDATQRLLDDQPGLSLGLHAGITEAEQARRRGEAVLEEIRSQRRMRAIPGGILLGLGLVTGGAAVLQVTLAPFAMRWELLAAGGAVLAAIGGGLLAAAARLRADERREARDDLERVNERLAGAHQKRQANERELAALARALGCSDTPELLRSWTDRRRLEQERQPAQHLATELAGLDASHAELMRQAGNPPGASFLEQAAQGIRTRILLLQNRGQIEEQAAVTGAQLAQVQAKLGELEALATAVLAQAGLERHPEFGWAEHTTEVTHRAHAAQRVAALWDELIPQARRHVLDPDAVRLHEQTLAMIEADAAADPAAVSPVSPRSLADIERESMAVRARLDELHRERGELRLRVEEMSRRFHEQHPDKVSERERVARAIVKARRFKTAVDLARSTIQKVALETHRRWAEFLNERVSGFVDSVGTGVEQVRFGEDLDFAVKPRRGQHVPRGKAVRQLSSGARDQLHLAVRLAISEYLSREESLPLLIDDCFATSDDGRARSGMKLLIEQFSPRHQVIVVTCHRRRCEALALADPELYRQRVHWIDTASMRSEAPR